jgi:hypothetical protein
MKTLKLRCTVTRYSRVSDKDVQVRYDHAAPVVMDWFWPAIEVLERASATVRISLSVWDVLSPALKGLESIPSWSSFVEIPIAELELETVRDLFIDIDNAFNRMWGADRGALRSSRVRRVILEYISSEREDGTLLRVKGSFRPHSRANYQPRKLISDDIGPSVDGTTAAPIGALPHSNAAELKSLTLKRLKDDLSQISDACQRELDKYDSACAILDQLHVSAVDEAVECLAGAALESARKSALNECIRSFTDRESLGVISCYLRIDRAPKAPHTPITYGGSSVLESFFGFHLRVEPNSFLRLLRYDLYPDQSVLIAAIVIIQISTSWNVSSVMELTLTGIEILPGGQLLIQSFKTKTGDDTPQVLLEVGDPANRAIRFVVKRLELIKSRGWASADVQDLWLSPRSNYKSSEGKPISNLLKGLQFIREKYRLPRFTFEQIRTQKLTITSLEKGPIAASEEAGHSTLGTIGGYIDHLLTRRHNSSINLEFQRRWEDEVVARLEGIAKGKTLFPVGDGSSCTAPDTPPDDRWLAGGVCTASHCHGEGGCANRALLIDRARVQEVVLIRRYYDSNWQRLYANNPELFAEVHVPRLEFNLHLHEYLKKGPYRHLVK